MKEIKLDTYKIEFTERELSPIVAKNYRNNEIRYEGKYIIIYCDNVLLETEYKNKLLNKTSRNLNKRISLIKEQKNLVNAGFNATYGNIGTLKTRLSAYRTAYNISKDNSILEKIKLLEQVISIKQG